MYNTDYATSLFDSEIRITNPQSSYKTDTAFDLNQFLIHRKQKNKPLDPIITRTSPAPLIGAKTRNNQIGANLLQSGRLLTGLFSTGLSTGITSSTMAGAVAGGGGLGSAVGAATAASTSAAATGAGLAGGSAAAAGATSIAALMGPLAIASFAIMALTSITAAKKQKKAIKKALQRERDLVITRNKMFENRMQLENMSLNDTLNQVERKAVKNRASFNVAKGETSSGATYNLLQQALKRNELEHKERLKLESNQRRIAQREHLVLQYHASRVKMQSIADQAPSNGDIALGIISDGINIATNYYSTTYDPNAPQVNKV